MKFKKIYIEITNCCNLKCSFCPTTERAPRVMTLDEFNRILNSIKGYTQHIYLHVKGEPLSHPNFQQFVKLASDLGFFVNITTNGTLIKKHAWFLTEVSPPRQINFSLHSFDGELDTIDSSQYLNDIFDFVNNSLLEEKTYISLRLWNYNASERADIKNVGNNRILSKIKEKFSFNSDLSSLITPGKGVKLREHLYLNSDIEFKWPNLSNEYISNRGYCLGLKDHIGILSNGDVVPCCLDGEGIITLGNIFLEEFSNILNSPRTKAIKDGFSKKIAVEELCQKCDFKTRF